MRTKILLIGSLALFLCACSSRRHAPPPLDKSLLAGKWRNLSETQFLVGYDFNEDGTVKMSLRGAKEPIPGRFTWIGERKVDLVFSRTEDVQKAYEEAVKAYKDWVKDKIEKKEMSDKAGPSLRDTVPDKLPAKETLNVGISSADPSFLTLARPDDGFFRTYKRAD